MCYSFVVLYLIKMHCFRLKKKNVLSPSSPGFSKSDAECIFFLIVFTTC